jgi:hypothetical protein
MLAGAEVDPWNTRSRSLNPLVNRSLAVVLKADALGAPIAVGVGSLLRDVGLTEVDGVEVVAAVVTFVATGGGTVVGGRVFASQA